MSSPITIIPIDRIEPFDPATFMGEGWTIDDGWSIWKGPKEGEGLLGDEEHDLRSLTLAELDLSTVRLKTMLKDDEICVQGEEKLRRLKADGGIRLDVQVFHTLWKNQHLIPEHWKEQTNGDTTYVFFDGTILRDSDGDRYVICLFWEDGAWDWQVDWLVGAYCANNPSAVIEDRLTA